MMSTLFKDKLFLVLAVLLAITVVSWWLSASGGLDQRILGAILLFLAFVKVRLILVHYMETANTQWPIRLGFDAWVLLVGAMTIGLYLH